MKLLRDSILLRALSRLLAGRREVVRRPHAITVPAPLQRASWEPSARNNVVELHRPKPTTGSSVSTPASTDALPSSVHLALLSSR
jgi:hypothetical protein